MLQPDLTIQLDTEFGGIYWLAGDLTGNQQVEIITMKYYVEATDKIESHRWRFRTWTAIDYGTGKVR